MPAGSSSAERDETAAAKASDRTIADSWTIACWADPCSAACSAAWAAADTTAETAAERAEACQNQAAEELSVDTTGRERWPVTVPD